MKIFTLNLFGLKKQLHDKMIKIGHVLILTLFLSTFGLVSWGQSAGDYRSSASGNWNAIATWETYDGSMWIAAIASPTSTDGVITIRSPHIVTISAAGLSYDQVTVDAGAQVTVASTIASTLANGTGTDLVINGTWLNSGGSWTVTGTAWSVGSGGTYIHNTTSGASTPFNAATFDANSTVIFRGSSTLTPAVTYSGRTFGNLQFESTSGSWSNAALSGSAASSCTNYSIGSGVTLNLGIYSGIFTINGNFANNGSITFGVGTQTYTFAGSNKTISGSGTIAFEALNINSGASITATVPTSINATFTGTVTGTFATSATFTNNGTLNVDGTFQINQGGWATGTNFVYGASSVLSFANSSGSYGVNADVFWPAASGPPNVTVAGAGGITMNVARTVSGVFQTVAGVTNANNLTLNGTGKLNTGGYFTGVPVWGASSTLIYNTGGTFGRGNEFPTSGNLPSNVQVSGSTTINYPNGGGSFSRVLTGDLTIDAGSALYMDYGSPGTGVGTLTCNNFIQNGAISLGNQPGGDLIIKGNYTRTGTFTPNGRAVFFNGASGNQTVIGVTNFDYVIVDKASDNVVMANNITVNNTLTLTSGNLSIGANTLTLNGLVVNTSGTLIGSTTSNLVVNGTAGTIQFTSGSTNNYLRNLDLGAAGSMTIGSNGLNIAAGATPGVVTIANGGVLTTGGNLTLKSDANGTARIASNTSGGTYVSGNVTVERYINTDVVGRKWHLLSGISTSTSQNILSSWQEGGGAPSAANLGTWITKPGGGSGFDGSSISSSLLRYDNAVPSLSSVSVTSSGSINDEQGYFLFVRGDRYANPANALTAPTVLRNTGALRQGGQAITILNSAPGYSMVGNPFASPLDLETPLTTTNLGQFFYIWDASQVGPYGVGKYILVQKTAAGTYTATPTTGSDNSLRYIHSGQAFFLKTNGGGNAAITFNETEKSASTSVVNPIVNSDNDQQLYVGMGVVTTGNIETIVDAVRIRFNPGYTAATTDDIEKIGNFTDNVSSYRNGKRWIVEMRPLVVKTDTIFLKMANTGLRNYRFSVSGINFNQPGVTAWLQDAFTGINTPVNLQGVPTVLDFSVTSDPATSNPDRFRIVFTNNASQLPPTITKVKATQQGSDIAVEWKVTSQQNMAKYEVEKSTNGTNFAKVNSQDAVGINGSDMNYNWLDQQAVAGDNYYRIRSIGIGGEVKISQVVKVTISKGNPAITVYPNPVINRTIAVQFNGMEKGTYQLRLINTVGQPVYTQSISHAGGSATQTLKLNSAFANGNYQLEILKPDNTKTVRSLTINE